MNWKAPVASSGFGVLLKELTWLYPPPHSEPKAAWFPWRSHGQRSHSARNPLELWKRKWKYFTLLEIGIEQVYLQCFLFSQCFKNSAFIPSVVGCCVFPYHAQSVLLAATMMDGFIKRLTQLFFCLHTLTNMPSRRGYHSIKPCHSSLPDMLTGLQHSPPFSFAVPSCNYTDVEPAQSWPAM